MPGWKRHLDQANQNLSLADSLRTGQFPQWAVVATFYAALHLVDAYLDRKVGYHPGNHGDRLKQFSRISDLKPLWTDYREMLDRSRDARYNCVQFTNREADALLHTHFDPVKSHIDALLGLVP
ncbi:MAG: hypothetical protein HYU88_05020 [Chloroflexi bacterium]|nr:hypothetical protein [Chloroflexota bacterium]MBI4504128.1 hypothetical protein [Chloroflexota bacterium]